MWKRMSCVWSFQVVKLIYFLIEIYWRCNVILILTSYVNGLRKYIEVYNICVSFTIFIITIFIYWKYISIEYKFSIYQPYLPWMCGASFGWPFTSHKLAFLRPKAATVRCGRFWGHKEPICGQRLPQFDVAKGHSTVVSCGVKRTSGHKQKQHT